MSERFEGVDPALPGSDRTIFYGGARQNGRSYLAEVGRRIRNSEIFLPARVVPSDPADQDTADAWSEVLRFVSDSERRALLDGDWSAYEDNASSGAAMRYQRDQERAQVSEWERLRHEVRRLRAENRTVALDNQRLRQELDDLRATHGYSNDNSPALGGQKEER